jgi:hypothetical protein
MFVHAVMMSVPSEVNVNLCMWQGDLAGTYAWFRIAGQLYVG